MLLMLPLQCYLPFFMPLFPPLLLLCCRRYGWQRFGFSSPCGCSCLAKKEGDVPNGLLPLQQFR